MIQVIGKILENNNDMLNYIPSIKDNDIIFPRGDDIRHFSTIHYTRILSNGEKHDRKWLVYLKDTDQVFCFCCKLFELKRTSQLCNEGTRD